MAGKRRFGRVRQLPSGRFPARHPGPDGLDRPAQHTFATKSEADTWLVLKEAEIKRGEWLDPDAGKVAFFNFVAFLVFGTAMANTVGSTVKKDFVSLAVVFAALLGAITWEAIKTSRVDKALLFLVISPAAGLVLAAVATGHLSSPGDKPAVPLWVAAGAVLAIALGTYSGGWRIVRTMGMSITRLRPVSGFTDEIAPEEGEGEYAFAVRPGTGSLIQTRLPASGPSEQIPRAKVHARQPL